MTIIRNAYARVQAVWRGDEVFRLIGSMASKWFIVSVVGAFLALSAQVMLARMLHAKEYGVYILVLAWMQLLVTPAVGGGDNTVLKFVPQYLSRSQFDYLKGLLVFGSGVVLTTSVILAITAWPVVLVFGIGIAPSGRHDTMIFVGLALLPILALMAIWANILRGAKFVLAASVPIQIVRPMLLLVAILAISKLSGRPIDSSIAIWANVFAAFCALLILGIAITLTFPKDLRTTRSRFEARKWVWASLPIMFMSGMYIIMGRLDIIMIGKLMGSADAAVYAATGRLTEVVYFGMSAINSVVAPMISEYFSSGKSEKLQRTLTWSARGIGVMALVSVLFLVIFGDFILGLFGAEFRAGYAALMILLAGVVGNAMTGTVGFLMIMTNHQKVAAKIVGVSAIANVILNLILIPKYGIEGAAIATALTTIAWNASMFLFVRKTSGINCSAFVRLK